MSNLPNAPEGFSWLVKRGNMHGTPCVMVVLSNTQSTRPRLYRQPVRDTRGDIIAIDRNPDQVTRAGVAEAADRCMVAYRKDVALDALLDEYKS